MKCLKIISLVLALLNICILNGQQDSILPLKKINIAIVKDGPSSFNLEIETNIKKEIVSLLSGQAIVTFENNMELTGNWTMQSVNSIIDRLLVESKVDIIITLGAISSQNICLRKNIAKPVVAPFTIDYKLQKIPYSNGTSGVKNLSYIIIPQNVESDIRFFSKLVGFKNVSVIFSKIYLKEMFGLEQLNSYTDEETGIRIDYILVDSLADEVISKLSDDIDAIYLSNILHFPESQLIKLIKEINKKKIPSFAANANQVKLGFLASLNPNIKDRLVKRISLNIEQIIMGEDPSKFTVNIFTSSDLTINLKTFEQIRKLAFKWDIITNADIVESGFDEDENTKYNIREILQLALDSNLDLSAKKLEINSAEKNIDISRSYLLPQVDFNMQGQKTGNSMPEEAVQFQISANQLIYSQAIWSDLSVSEYLYKAKQSELTSTKFSILKNTADYYLDVMKARRTFLILWENLKISRTNLTIAKQRFDAGAADKSEVIRWESQVASAKKDAIAGYSLLIQSILQLLQVLHSRDLSNHDLSDLTIDDPLLLTSKQSFINILEDPMLAEKLSNFYIKEAIDNSPEIKVIDSYLAAKKEQASSLTKSHFIPEFYGYGYYYNYLYKSESVLPLPNNDWSVGIKMSLPLFKGFSVTNATEQAEIDIDQLTQQRNSIVEKIEQTVRTLVTNLETMYFSIQQSNIAQKSAEENLALINNSYILGEASFLLLLDAQTQLLSAQLAAIDSYNNFLRIYFEIQSLICKFDPLLSEAELEDYLQKILNFVK